MKKLIVLYLTLGLTFSRSYLFAGGCCGKVLEDQVPLLSDFLNRQASNPSIDCLGDDALSLIIKKLIETGSATDIQACLSTNRKLRSLIEAILHAHDRLVIQKYSAWLKNIPNNPFATVCIPFGCSHCVRLPKPPSFHPDWLEDAVMKSDIKPFKAIKQLILFEFVRTENVSLIAARLIFNAFLEHHVDLNAKYFLNMIDIDNDVYYPQVSKYGYTLLEKAKQKNRVTPIIIIQALEEAIEKQKNQN